MKKGILCTVLLLALLLVCVVALPTEASAATSGTCGENVTWNLNDAGTLTISGTGAMRNYSGSNYVPWYSSSSSVKTVVIGGNVTSIGSNAFAACNNLNSVVIGNGVISIRDHAFSFCKNLTRLTIPDSVTHIGDNAFECCTSLTSLTIPNSVTSIGDQAFCGCNCLTIVSMGNSVSSIGEYAFGDCDSLTGIWVDANNLFYSSDSSGVLFNKDKTVLIQAPCALQGEYAVPNSVTSIGNYAFDCCTSLTSVTIGNSVTDIGNCAFRYCYSLTSVTIGNSVTSIGNDAFYNCYKLVEVINHSGITITAGSSNNGYVAYYAKEIHNGESEIVNTGEYLFYTYNGINYLLCYTGNDTALVLPGFYNGQTYEIYPYAFYKYDGNHNVIYVTIPDSVTSIGSYAFSRHYSLISITMGNSVASVSNSAFSSCYKLDTVKYRGSKEDWNNISIGDDNSALLNTTKIYNYECYHNYIGTLTKEPTRTATGERTHMCAYCANTYTEVIPALFYGTNLDLGNSLNLNFYFYKGVVGTDGYVEIVRTFADGTTETATKSLSEFALNGDYYQITYPGLAASEMNDSVSVTVYDKDGNRVSETKTDSICSYTRRALDKITDPVSRRLYVDMLNYGAAAQQNFGYNTENLANSILTEAEKAEGTQSVAPLTNGYTRENEYYYGTNFDLENEIKLNLYVLASAMGEDGYAEISYTNFKGEEIEKTVTEYTVNGDYYVFTPDFVVAADGRCLLTVQFYYTADGTPVVKVTDSMESYVARAVEEDPAKYRWMEQMMIYSDSARAYLNQ